MIVESDNTAKNMLVDRLGRDLLNAYFRQLGLKNTSLGNSHFISASDLAFLLGEIYYGRVADKASCDQQIKILTDSKWAAFPKAAQRS